MEQRTVGFGRVLDEDRSKKECRPVKYQDTGDKTALLSESGEPNDQRRKRSADAPAVEAAADGGYELAGVARACRHFGISRKSFYKWKKRFDEYGDSGLCDRPRAPLRSPKATPPEVVSKILHLRQNYHFGARKIADYLKRFHSISVAGSTVQRILEKHGMQKLPANQKHRQHAKRWKRYEKPQLGHRLQMDV